ncbi:MAG: hypothetical protein NWE76_05680 [Candidatus Bathyarchaeota archaeon]|nr:hypothetical protein [Candidatus Bathyarchaeota archaeon]
MPHPLAQALGLDQMQSPETHGSVDFDSDSLMAFIMENAHLLDETEPEDPSISDQDVNLMEGPSGSALSPIGGEYPSAPDVQSVQDRFLAQAREKDANSQDFQQRHRNL